MFLSQEEHFKNRKLSKIGASIASGVVTTDLHVPPDQALYIMEYGKMGKVGYTTLRLSMLPYGVIFPPYDTVSKYRKEHLVPAQKEEFKDDQDIVIGLSYKYRESLQLSVSRLISTLDIVLGKFW